MPVQVYFRVLILEVIFSRHLNRYHCLPLYEVSAEVLSELVVFQEQSGEMGVVKTWGGVYLQSHLLACQPGVPVTHPPPSLTQSALWTVREGFVYILCHVRPP